MTIPRVEPEDDEPEISGDDESKTAEEEALSTEAEKKRWADLTRDDIIAGTKRSRKKTQKQWDSRKKLTLETIRSETQERERIAEQRRAARGERKLLSADQLRVGIAGVAALGAAALVVVNVSAGAEHEQAGAAHAAEVDQLSAQLQALTPETDGDDGSADDDVAAISASLEAARADADELAQLQDEFAELYYDADQAVADGEVAEGQSAEEELEAVSHRTELQPYFADSALVADESDLEEAGRAAPLGSSEMDPRWPWHLPGSGDGVRDHTEYSWDLISAMPVEDDAHLVEVAWALYDEDDVLLAWAEGLYDAQIEQFTRISTGSTTHGGSTQ